MEKKIKKIAILGNGRSGIAVAQLANKLDIFNSIFADGYGELPNFNKSNYDLIVISPGIPPTSPIAQLAKESKIEVIGELEFASRYCKAKIIAITGTNGKTTTVEFVTHSLNCLGYSAIYAGNIGVPLSEVALSENFDFIVVEVSSFQLETVKSFKPIVAGVLNITSDHIDRHKSFANYAKLKFSIFAQVANIKDCILNTNLINSEYENSTSFSAYEKADFYIDKNNIYFENMQIISTAKIQLVGNHNYENILAGLALIHRAVNLRKINIDKLRIAIKSFKASEHRLEFLGKTKDNISFYNDSKATNPDSVLVAVNAIATSKNVLLILGGLDKDMDFEILLSIKNKIKIAFLIGESQEKIKDTISNHITCDLCNNLEIATCAAIKSSSPNDIILLSPGCASMDQFKNYKERGEKFKKLVTKQIL